MDKKITGAVTAVIITVCILIGCDESEKFESGSRRAASYGRVVEQSIEQAEPVISSLEDATGRTLPAETSKSAATIAEKVDIIATKIEKIGSIVSVAPGPQQPIVGGIVAIAGAVAGIAGGIATMFRKRQKQAEKGLKVVTAAIDDIKGIGNKITTATVNEGVADVVQKAYLDNKTK